jgi:hypothetical protein
MFLSPLGERLGEGVNPETVSCITPSPSLSPKRERSLRGGRLYRAMNSAATTRKAISAVCCTAPKVSPV